MIFRFISAFVLLALWVLAGCTGSPDSPSPLGSLFSKSEYTLTPLGKNEITQDNPSARRNIAIGVAPVHLADHLDKPQIVAKGEPKKEGGTPPKWAKPLQENFSNVLAENLSLIMASERVSVISEKNSDPKDYQVMVEIRAFEGELGKEGFLDARWTILGNQGTETIFMRNSSFHQPVAKEGMEGVVAAMNQTLSDLSQEIAAALQAVSKK